jgi:hypothetical protein
MNKFTFKTEKPTGKWKSFFDATRPKFSSDKYWIAAIFFFLVGLGCSIWGIIHLIGLLF